MKQLFEEVNKWSEKYEFSFQFWGDHNNNVWLYKDGVELFDCGGRETIEEVVKDTLKYIYKQNQARSASLLSPTNERL